MEENNQSDERPYCPECGVPQMISMAHSWLSDGSIVLAVDPAMRMVFVETENLDPLFRGIGELIGTPIEPFVSQTSRRATRSYMRRLIPRTARELVRDGEVGVDTIMETMLPVAHFMGYGSPLSYSFQYNRDAGDYMVIRYTEPYSVTLLDGNLAGTVEAFTEMDNVISHKQLTPTTHELTLNVSMEPPEEVRHLKLSPYEPGEGGVELPRCRTCGVPAALAGNSWDTEWGIIRGRATGRRMAMLGPVMLDPVFNELETELGPDVPAVVVEAERRFVRNGFYSVSEVRSEEEMRDVLALRGLGELRELKMGRRGVTLGVDNAAMHLVVAGLTQGLYELAFGRESRVEWELADGGVLRVAVTPW